MNAALHAMMMMSSSSSSLSKLFTKELKIDPVSSFFSFSKGSIEVITRYIHFYCQHFSLLFSTPKGYYYEKHRSCRSLSATSSAGFVTLLLLLLLLCPTITPSVHSVDGCVPDVFRTVSVTSRAGRSLIL